MTVRVLVIFGTSVLPPRLCLTCGFPPTFGFCAIGMYSDWFTIWIWIYNLLLSFYFSFSRHRRGKRILGFQLRAKAHSALVFRPTWLASRGLLFVYVVDSLMYAMGDPFTVDHQLGVFCTFAVGTKGHGRPWLRSCGHNMEFWVCNFGSFHFRGRKGIAHHCMPVGGQTSTFLKHKRNALKKPTWNFRFQLNLSMHVYNCVLPVF